MNYYYFINWPWVEFQSYMKIYMEHTVERQSIPAGTTVPLFERKGVGICIWLKATKEKDPEVWAHECLHATNMTLGLRGVVPDFDNDEPQAYLLTNIMSQGRR